MSGRGLKEETPVPVTDSKDGRGNSGVNSQRYAFAIKDASTPYSSNHDALLVALSAKRFGPYVADGADVSTGIARYALNIALSEALYPIIHTLEIALRNAIHNELCRINGASDWYENIDGLKSYHQSTIAVAKDKSREKFLKSGRPLASMEPDDVIAELPLGFWTAFFNKKATSSLTLKLIKPVFKNAPRRMIRLDVISDRTSRFRKLRNRVFHHERIIHWKDLLERHAEITEMIGWISTELMSMCTKHDRFLEVHSKGIKPWL
jgi:hypothetical protein